MIKRIINFLIRYWQGIGFIATLLALFLQQRQIALQQQQFTIEQAQKPNLVFDYQVSLSKADSQLINDEAGRLTELFFEKIYAEKADHPEDNFTEILNRIIPVSTSILSSPLILNVVVENQGLSTANNVHVRIDISRPISNIEINSLEPAAIIDGGVGSNQAIFDVARIIPNGRFSITIVSDELPSEKQDRLSIDFSQFQDLGAFEFATPFPTPNPEVADFFGGGSIRSWFDPFVSSIDYLPTIKYIPSAYTKPQIYISSDEGGAIESNLITPSPNP